MKTVKVDIPNYLTIKHYLGFQMITDIKDDIDLVINTVSIMTDNPIDEIRQWGIDNLVDVYKALVEVQLEVQPEFYPILEVEGVLYGFQPISKMTIGEHMDLERLCKDPQKNLPEITAILYRPIKEHKLRSLEFQVKSNIKALVGGNEHLFPYYTLEPYDANQRKIDKEKMLNFPASIALGAYSFFLLTGEISLENSQISSHQPLKLKEEKTITKVKSVFQNTMDGYSRYMSLQALPSYKSQEISRLSI